MARADPPPLLSGVGAERQTAAAPITHPGWQRKSGLEPRLRSLREPNDSVAAGKITALRSLSLISVRG